MEVSKKLPECEQKGDADFCRGVIGLVNAPN